MAETGTNVQETSQTQEVAQQANGLPPELVAEMNKSLIGFIPGQEQQQTQTVAEQQVATTTSTEQVQTQQAAATETLQEVVSDPFAVFKEKFGYQAPEDAIKEIEELRQLKTAQPAPLKFENEQSEKIAKALAAGKLDEVYEALNKQHRLEALTSAEVSKDNAADIVKYGMQLKYPSLTPAQIEFQFKQDYNFPKEPVIKDTEDELEFNERHNQWKEQVSNLQMKMEIAATMAKPELEAAKAKIVFPETEQTINQEYVQWQKIMDEQAKLDAQIQEAYKTVTPKSIETKLSFNDEANKIKFDFQYEPDADSFTKTVEVATDVDKLIKHFVQSDGTFDRTGYLKAIDFALNRDKYLLEAMKQSKNATLKSNLPDNSGGTQRQFPQHQELSDLDKQMKVSLNGFMPA